MAKQSKTVRWAMATQAALDAIQALQELQEEYRDWRDNLPENLEGSETAAKLDAVIDIDIDTVFDVIQEAADVELPLGFGRD